jgi:hypothetical protein
MNHSLTPNMEKRYVQIGSVVLDTMSLQYRQEATACLTHEADVLSYVQPFPMNFIQRSWQGSIPV